MLLEGINDIGRSAVDGVTADDIIFGYRQLITRAHERGVAIFGATLTPRARARRFTPALEAKRAAVNAFIRTSGEFDGVIDFDAATRDPGEPAAVAAGVRFGRSPASRRRGLQGDGRRRST